MRLLAKVVASTFLIKFRIREELLDFRSRTGPGLTIEDVFTIKSDIFSILSSFYPQSSPIMYRTNILAMRNTLTFCP